MDIKDLNKHQLILLTLLITFVVSIATGIVTVSLMNQAPKSVPQTINNVIQRTIERVTTVEEGVGIQDKNVSNTDNKDTISLLEENILIKIYKGEEVKESNLLGEGVLLSDSGIIMIDSGILNGDEAYIAVLDTTNFNATVIKKFNNGFSILKISERTEKPDAGIPPSSENIKEEAPNSNTQQ